MGMGIIADFGSIPPGRWPEVLSALRAVGIAIEEDEPLQGGWSWGFIRDGASVGLFYDPGAKGLEVCLYCSAQRYWRRPLTTRRLIRDVEQTVRTAGGTFPETSPWRDWCKVLLFVGFFLFLTALFLQEGLQKWGAAEGWGGKAIAVAFFGALGLYCFMCATWGLAALAVRLAEWFSGTKRRHPP